MTGVSFAALPPEVTSGWLYTGPGAESMLSAATAWDRLAGELSSAAADYRSVITALTADPWHGPAATAMSAAAAPYTEWMTVTAEQARQAATGARAAAAAYQAAHAAVVPPPVITANRSTLQHLLATNVIGQNSAAIAANQAQYGEMWAQNASTMDGYTHAAASAASLAPFTQPAQSTDQAGQSNQAAAVAQATTQSGATQSDWLVDFLKQINGFLNINPAAGPLGNPAWTSAYMPILEVGKLVAAGGAPGYMAIATPMQMLGPVWHSFFPHIFGGAAAAATMGEVSGPGLGQTLVKAATPTAGLSAGLGRAATVGGLSVPQTWATPIQLASASAPLPGTALAAAPAAGMGGMGGVPMVPALLDKPGNHTGPKGPGAKIVGRLGAGAGATRRRGSGIASPLSDRERTELDKLRAIVADLTNQRDNAANSIKEAIRS
ncbi:PPE family protein [Mycobacterium sp. M1]|uniref:PPE family protein n=1 Tax=Mycolicibacter acidiphilus TaxID=2835306 RepID=A0ABS5RJJ1_9MYCO|nr:PPE family protein [Mycolicibacter acidiphilus]MBS9534451.1 PPE family protein [Mycolicibacter acidiphilus]